MRIFILGKVRSLTHWLEDIVLGLKADGHQIAVGATRNPSIPRGLESALGSSRFGAPSTAWIAHRIRTFAPDLILAIDPYFISREILGRVSELPGRAPLAGWVGHLFDDTARDCSAALDVVGYVDTGLVELHQKLEFAPRPLYLPHAIDQHSALHQSVGGRREPTIVFVGNPTPHRRCVVDAVRTPLALFGPGWRRGSSHIVSPHRVKHSRLPFIYSRHLASLNIRNEQHVLRGLNQRSFQPYIFGAPVVSDDQGDLDLCFKRGVETLIYRDTKDLNEIYDQLRGNPIIAKSAAERGLARVLADHTFARRLRTLMDGL